MITELTDLTDAQRTARAHLMSARDEVCRACEHRTFIWSGWTWARCWARGVGADGKPTFALSGAFAGMDDKGNFLGVMDGPESGCPLGKWKGVVALPEDNVDRAAEAAEWLVRYEPLLKRLPNKEVDVVAALDEMVADGWLSVEAANERKKILDAPEAERIH